MENIDKIKIPDYKHEPIHQKLIFLGPQRSGKSTSIKYLMKKQKFDIYIIMSNNEENRLEYVDYLGGLGVSKKQIILTNKFSESVIESLIKISDVRKKKNLIPIDILIVLDDLFEQDMKKSDYLNKIFISSRHFHISLWWGAHSLNQLSQAQIENVDILFFYKTNNLDQKYKVLRNYFNDVVELPVDFSRMKENKLLASIMDKYQVNFQPIVSKKLSGGRREISVFKPTLS